MKRFLLSLCLLVASAATLHAQILTEAEFAELVRDHLDQYTAQYDAKRLDVDALLDTLESARNAGDHELFGATLEALHDLDDEMTDINEAKLDFWAASNKTFESKYPGKKLINYMPMPGATDLFIGAWFFRQTLCEEGAPTAVAELAWDAAPDVFQFAGLALGGALTKITMIPFQITEIQGEIDSWWAKFNEVMAGTSCGTENAVRTRIRLDGAISGVEDAYQQVLSKPFYDGKSKHAAELSYIAGHLRDIQQQMHYYEGGDTDSDDDVDYEDFLRFQQNFGKQTGATWDEGDFDHDGDVDFADFLSLEENYTGSEPLE
jgi:hypothetical protein